MARLAVAIGVAGALGCDLFEPSEYGVIGIIYFDNTRILEDFSPDIPEAVSAGVPFEITVRTAGNGGDRTSVQHRHRGGISA